MADHRPDRHADTRLYHRRRGAAARRRVASVQRVINADAADTLPARGKTAILEIEIDAGFDLGIGEAIRTRMA